MNTEDELKANDKCQTCKFQETCAATSDYLIAQVESLKLMGCKACAVVYSCKQYRKR